MFNKFIGLGNITRDIEMRFTPKGTAVAQFGLAMNRKWKNEAGEQQEEVTFVDVTAWGRTGETISQYFKKGNPILIEGRLKQDNWDDKQTGAKRTKFSVVVETFSFVGARNDTQRAATDATSESAAPRTAAPRTARERVATNVTNASPADSSASEADEPDIPF